MTKESDLEKRSPEQSDLVKKSQGNLERKMGKENGFEKSSAGLVLVWSPAFIP